jgi:hypothetical protein
MLEVIFIQAAQWMALPTIKNNNKPMVVSGDPMGNGVASEGDRERGMMVGGGFDGDQELMMANGVERGKMEGKGAE